jgi:hypothetical protein
MGTLTVRGREVGGVAGRSSPLRSPATSARPNRRTARAARTIRKDSRSGRAPAASRGRRDRLGGRLHPGRPDWPRDGGFAWLRELRVC